MGFQALLVGLFPLCQAQFAAPSNFFSPSFATSALPLQMAFPKDFTSQTLFLPFKPLPTKPSKKDQAGVYTPEGIPIPTDPAASAALTNLLTSKKDKVIDGKGTKAIKALYDQNSFRSFNMEMSIGNRNLMNLEPTKEISVHCRLTTDYNTPQAKTWADFAVGCGYKGSVGSLRVCLDENNRDNHICRKLSFRVDAKVFNTKNDNHSAPLIHGMEALFFGGMPVDLAMVSERTAYTLMNSLGMVASLSTHAKLFLNGKYLGLFSFVQGVDEQFTKMHFGDDDRKGKGGLYKELWLNPLHVKNVKDYHKGGEKQDDAFIQEVMTAMQNTPLIGDAPRLCFEKYFDVQSLVDMTAFNTAIGSTDDWRQRHNFFLYVRQTYGVKKIVFIPWDYDRLYDAGSETRGALKGQPWWDIKNTATSMACNALIISTQEQANSIGGTWQKIAWNKAILDEFPEDMNIPVTCDKMTQLMAVALGSKIRQRTREITAAISISRVRALWAGWNAQIKTALEKDPSGPTYNVMLGNQELLASHLTNSANRANNEANTGDATAQYTSTPPDQSNTFAAKSLSTTSFSFPASATPSFSSASVPFPPASTTPSFSISASTTPSFSLPTAPAMPSFTFAAPSFSIPSFPRPPAPPAWG